MEQRYKKAQALSKDQKYTEAAREFESCLDQVDDNADLWSDYAVTLFHLNQMEKAIEAFNRSQVLDPDNPYRYSSRAYIHSIMGNTQLAIADYQKCIELDPSDAIALNNLGLVYEKQGHQSHAQKLYQKADEIAGIDHITQTGTPKQEVQNPSENTLEKEPSLLQEMVRIVGTRKGWKEFWTYIKRGYKIK